VRGLGRSEESPAAVVLSLAIRIGDKWVVVFAGEADAIRSRDLTVAPRSGK
jgi:hypothetical protein